MLTSSWKTPTFVFSFVCICVLSSPRDADPSSTTTGSTVSAPRKRRKVASAEDVAEIDGMLMEWDLFAEEVADFDVRHVRAGGRFVFSFVEGPLVKALRKGDW